MHWLQWYMVTSPNLFLHLDCWTKERNYRIFNNKAKEMDEIMDDIKVLSWHWSLSRLKVVASLYY